ncbi:MAG: selenocysteine-specific translation elongation factor, partial [Limisphaerales bacterium]
MAKRNFIVATAGHVDHGKSSLVKALTNTDPDRLPEEKKRGITIELGFAHLQLPDPANADNVLEIGLIDVPGHEDFVQNMVMGVGAADAALLVVAADDGWMPQTEEHLQILSYLGVQRGIIAVTKTDLPEADPELAVEMVKEEVADTVFEKAPIVATSVVTEGGMDELKMLLAQFLGEGLERPVSQSRLWVDRAFTMRGSGTVITGTVEGASFTAGQNVLVQPKNIPARIRGLQSFGEVVEEAVPATRTAVNLPDVDISADKGKAYISRGDVIVSVGGACSVVDVSLHKSSRPISERSPANKPLKHGARVRLHLGTSNTPARVHLATDDPLTPGGSVFAQLRCESPVFAREGDRFTLRDWPETATLAGGQVLEIDSARRTFRREPQQKFLRARAAAQGSLGAWITSVLDRDGFVKEKELLKQSVFPDAQLAEALAALTVKRVGDWLVGEGRYDELKAPVCQTIGDWHRKRPELPGYPLVKLRASVVKDCSEALLDALLAELEGISVTGNFVH